MHGNRISFDFRHNFDSWRRQEGVLSSCPVLPPLSCLGRRKTRTKWNRKKQNKTLTVSNQMKAHVAQSLNSCWEIKLAFWLRLRLNEIPQEGDLPHSSILPSYHPDPICHFQYALALKIFNFPFVISTFYRYIHPYVCLYVGGENSRNSRRTYRRCGKSQSQKVSAIRWRAKVRRR